MPRLTGKKTVTTVTPDAIGKAITGVLALGKEIDARKLTAAAQESKVLPNKDWKKWKPVDVLPKLDIMTEESRPNAWVLKLIADFLPDLQQEAPEQKKMNAIEPWDWITGNIENMINDGAVDWAQYSDEPAQYTKGALPASVADDAKDRSDQPIIEVSQERVKEALKILLTNKNNMISKLYDKHEEYNGCHFCTGLSTPIITIDKLNNRTLANYTDGKDSMELEHHIRFNHNFVALNEDPRIFETLIHEMIHQWQDEVLYAKPGSDHLKPIKMPVRGEDDEITYVEAFQKKRPKEWHNKDFKDMAAICGIPAKGSKCYGNPANMPKPESYNRKYMCGCLASNTYPLTIWSTRPVNAICQDCVAKGRTGKFIEVTKKDPDAKTIEVRMSHVEGENQDAVHDAMTTKYQNFERFDTKGKKDDFVGQLNAGEAEESPVTELEQGVYQKNHNGYKWGYRYWVAYNTEVTADKPTAEDIKDAAADKAKGKRKKTEPPVATDTPSEVKKPKGKILKFPTDAPATPPTPAPPERVYSLDNPQDIIDLYATPMTVRQIGEKLGVAQSTVSARIKKLKINLTTLTFEQ